MEKQPKYGKILTVILMVLLFLPMLQEKLNLFPMKPLNGENPPTELPEFNTKSFQSGDYAMQTEAYLGTHFGFREPIVRLYNQYLWDCYGKTYAHDVVKGKQGWLYYPQSVDDYYGTELLQWQPSTDEARRNYDLDLKYMDWVRTILKENGTELMVFMAPEKSFLYPKHLPERVCDTTTFNAREYFERRLVEARFPCIEMTRWFSQAKDTVGFLLIPQTGGHWNFSSVYAADSLFRFMGTLKGIALPRLQIGDWHESEKSSMKADNDLELLLNLWRPIRKREACSPEAEVGVKADAGSCKPKALFIGNSFFWRMAHYVPFNQVFDYVEFWYYYSTAYYGDGFGQTRPVADYPLIEKLLDFDYVVWFTTGNQMYKGFGDFASNALVALAVDDSLMLTHARRIADSLRLDPDLMAQFDTVPPHMRENKLLWKAMTLIKTQPTLIPELRGDSLKIRSREIPYAKVIKDIRKDSLWMEALEAQAFLRSATLKAMLHAEADRLREGKQPYRDQKDEIRFAHRCQQEVEELMERLPSNEDMMEIIVKQANEYNKTIEESTKDNALWLIRDKYRLNLCRLADNPDAKIPLPHDLQLK